MVVVSKFVPPTKPPKIEEKRVGENKMGFRVEVKVIDMDWFQELFENLIGLNDDSVNKILLEAAEKHVDEHPPQPQVNF